MEAADGLNRSNATDKLEAIQSELFCGICHDFFVQAFTLSCSHSFCFQCITAWRVNHVDCPVCRRETVGMAPSRALDNMVAALNGTGSDTSLNNSSNCQSNRNVSGWFNTPQNITNGNDNSQGGESDDGTFFDSDDEEVETDYLDYDSDYFEDEEEEEGYEDEVEEDAYEEEDVYEDEESYISDSDEDDEEYEDYNDEEYYAHAKRSNQSNPNNNEYWQIRGYAYRPSNWRELSRNGKH